MLLFIDGFDAYGIGSGLAYPAHKWTGGNAAVNIIATGRTVNCGVIDYSRTLTTPNFPPATTCIVGFAMRLPSPLSYAGDFLVIMEGSVSHIGVGLNTDRTFYIARGFNGGSGMPPPAQLLATSTAQLPLGTWVYIELKVVIHDTNGSYELRMDTVPRIGPATGVDTRNGGTTGMWNRVALTGIYIQEWNVDDVYIANGIAPGFIDFLGPVRVETLMPQTDLAAPGTYAELTPSVGTDHGALVDEVPPNASDHNSSTTVGARDTYHYPSPVLPGTVLAIQSNLYVQKSDSTDRKVRALVRTYSQDRESPDLSMETSFRYATSVLEMNPVTGQPWTAAELAGIEVGMKVSA